MGPVDFRIRDTNSHSWVSEDKERESKHRRTENSVHIGWVSGSRRLGRERLPPTK